MQQATPLDCLCSDLLSLFEDGFFPVKVDVGGGKVSQPLAIAVVVAVVYEDRQSFLDGL